MVKNFFNYLISPLFQGPVIENISQRCGGFLKFLSLKGCQSVGDQSIRTLANHCHNIEHLDLSECKKITDHAMQPLSKHCFKLTAIFLESCAQISDMSLKALSDGCPVRLLLDLLNVCIYWRFIRRIWLRLMCPGVTLLARTVSKLSLVDVIKLKNLVVKVRSWHFNKYD